jgi:hypothetical protein
MGSIVTSCLVLNSCGEQRYGKVRALFGQLVGPLIGQYGNGLREHRPLLDRARFARLAAVPDGKLPREQDFAVAPCDRQRQMILGFLVERHFNQKIAALAGERHDRRPLAAADRDRQVGDLRRLRADRY